MSKPVLAHITCPHCGNEHAEVHEQASKKKTLYYRCYASNGGDCGTVQIPFPAGQQFIRNNMRPLNAIEAEQQAEQAGLQARIEQQEKAEKIQQQQPKHEQKSSMFSQFFKDSEA